MVRRVRPDAKSLLRLSGAEAESPVSEPRENPLALIRGEGIGFGNLDPRPRDTLEWVGRKHAIDEAGVAQHRLEAPRQDVLDVLEREAALPEFGAKAEDVAGRDSEWHVPEKGKNVPLHVAAVVIRLRPPHLRRHLAFNSTSVRRPRMSRAMTASSGMSPRTGRTYPCMWRQ